MALKIAKDAGLGEKEAAKYCGVRQGCHKEGKKLHIWALIQIKN